LNKILLYHIYPVNNWKAITDLLFQTLPFEKIIVHVSLPENEEGRKEEVEKYFKDYPIDQILFSVNSGTGEVDAMKSLVRSVDLEGFDLLTYMHCKGVTKPENEHILEWTKLMRYFIIEKMQRCMNVFRKGYITYGINKSIPDQADAGFKGSNFFYEGNFVSVNLKKVELEKAVEEHLEQTYYGLEGFWGKLCSYERGYSIFNSGINHYLRSVPEKDYTTALGRWKYSLIKEFYSAKSKLQKKKG
jgi:hypothetical protein